MFLNNSEKEEKLKSYRLKAIRGDGGGEDEGVLPLKSWYIPGTMMMLMASSLLKVRRI